MNDESKREKLNTQYSVQNLNDFDRNCQITAQVMLKSDELKISFIFLIY